MIDFDLPTIAQTSSASMDMSTIYGIIGVIVVAQFGTIITVMIWLGKGIWWAAQKAKDIEELQKDVNAAHIKLRARDADRISD